MAKTLLNLHLFYRGKHLDTIREKTDFNKSWMIGTDKHLFWQILDDPNNIPRKHKFLDKRGNDYYLHLPVGSSLSCSKDNKPLDANDLQSGGILAGSLLKLGPGLSGTVQLNPDYEVRFEYTEPRIVVLKPQEQAVVNSSMQPRHLTSEERSQTGLILLFLILGIAFVLIYDQVIKPRLDKAKAVLELSELEKARRIEADRSLADHSGMEFADRQEQDQPPDRSTDEAGKASPDRKKTASRATTPGGRGSGTTDVGKVFGQPGSPRATPGATGTHYSVTGLQSFVTASPGVRAGEGIGGIPGSSSFDPKASTGFTGTYDPGNIQGYDPSGSGIGRVADKLPQQAGSLLPPGVPTQVFTGDASKLQPSSSSPTQSIPSAQEQAKKVTQTVTKPTDATKLTEPEVKIPKPAYTGSDANVIYSQISARKGQIEQAYRRNAAIKRQTGSITVVMNIGADGSVDNAQVSTSSATFTQSFLSEVKRIVESWRFNVSQATKYQFRMALTA